MRIFRRKLRDMEKAYKHLWGNPYYKVPKDDALNFAREVNYSIKEANFKGTSLKLKALTKKRK